MSRCDLDNGAAYHPTTDHPPLCAPRQGPTFATSTWKGLSRVDLIEDLRVLVTRSGPSNRVLTLRNWLSSGSSLSPRSRGRGTDACSTGSRTVKLSHISGRYRVDVAYAIGQERLENLHGNGTFGITPYVR